MPAKSWLGSQKDGVEHYHDGATPDTCDLSMHDGPSVEAAEKEKYLTRIQSSSRNAWGLPFHICHSLVFFFLSHNVRGS